jgi:predicted dienelactone hydrolase
MGTVGTIMKSFILPLAAIFGLLGAPASAANVGFDVVKIAAGPEAPLTSGVWYPTDTPATEHALGNFTQTVAAGAPIAGRDLPLVVISHGGASWYGSHYDTALALAQAGFVVAAVSHAGDTFDDQSKVLQPWRRPAQLRRLVDYMLSAWPQRDHLDANAIGAFGFSNGGFTVLVAVGGTPDLGKTAPYCRAHPDHDLCQVLKQAGVDLGSVGREAPQDAWVPDPRIKAAVIAAPAFGFSFGREGLERVRVPIQLWGAADDRHQPAPDYEDAVRASLLGQAEYHVVANAGHFDFLPPCNAHLSRVAPNICTSAAGFDRAKFHDLFNSEVVRFFRTELSAQTSTKAR